MNSIIFAVIAAIGGGFIYNGMGAMMNTRGVRNNNPGNIRLTNIDWDGKVPEEDNTDGEFEQFVSPWFGIRAMARNLLTYRERGVDTISQIVESWAPPVGMTNAGDKYKNDTPAYIKSVAKQTGIDPDKRLTPNVMPAVIAAMIVHENGGQPYSKEFILDATRAGGWEA